MGWGRGNHAPETARTVAKAFYEGRPCRRGNCQTDGFTYTLEATVIAIRRPPEVLVDNVAFMLTDEACRKRDMKPLEFTFGGWPTKTTARHLTALGVDAEVIGIKNPECYLGGNPASANVWYTPEDIKALPPKPPPKPKKFREPKFVNLTPDLFA